MDRRYVSFLGCVCYCLGLFFDSKINAACTFGSPGTLSEAWANHVARLQPREGRQCVASFSADPCLFASRKRELWVHIDIVKLTQRELTYLLIRIVTAVDEIRIYMCLVIGQGSTLDRGQQGIEVTINHVHTHHSCTLIKLSPTMTATHVGIDKLPGSIGYNSGIIHRFWVLITRFFIYIAECVPA